MTDNAAKLPNTRSFMGANAGFRLVVAALCLALLWLGVIWALA